MDAQVRKRESLWEHKLRRGVLTTFLVIQKLHSCFYYSIVTRTKSCLFQLWNSEKQKAESMAYFHYQTVTSPFALSLEVPLHWHLVLSEFSFFREVMGSIRFGDSDFFLVPRSCCVNWSIHLSIHYELQIHHLNSLISYKIVCFLGTNSIRIWNFPYSSACVTFRRQGRMRIRIF